MPYKYHFTVEDGRATTDNLLVTMQINNGILSKSKTIERLVSQSDTTVSSNITGGQVLMQAGQDMTIKGSNVVPDNQTVLSAQRNLNVVAAEDSSQSTTEISKTKSGLMGSGGIGFSIGSQKDKVNTNDVSTTHTGSSVGSLHGDVTVATGETYQQTGSRVSSPEGSTTIVAKEVNIEAAKDSYSDDYKHTLEKKGFTIAINVPIVSAVQTAVTATKRVGESKNARVNAMAAANSVYDSINAGNALSSAYNSPSQVTTNVSASINAPTGGFQRIQGTFLGSSYITGGLKDMFVESFAGTHDFLGGQIWGWYDKQGNTTNGRYKDDNHDRAGSNITTVVAIPVAAPFALADYLSPSFLQLVMKIAGH